jgi:hypothetical protein
MSITVIPSCETAGLAEKFEEGTERATQRHPVNGSSCIAEQHVSASVVAHDDTPFVDAIAVDAARIESWTLRPVVALGRLSTFAGRLNRLFEIAHPPGRGPFSSTEVVSLVRARGAKFSTPYLSQLRRGRRTQPSAEIVNVLSAVFGLEPGYLSGSDTVYCQNVDEDLGWLRLTRDSTVRELTTAILELSPDAQEEIVRMIDERRGHRNSAASDSGSKEARR